MLFFEESKRLKAFKKDVFRESLLSLSSQNSMATKDTRYLLHTIDTVKSQPEYIVYKLDFDHFKFYVVKSDGIDVKIFNVAFCCFITSEVFPAMDMDSGNETSIKGSDYLRTYIEGYIEGCHYFKIKHERDPFLLSEENKQLYIETIKENFYHSGYKGLRGHNGWNYIVTSMPKIITHSSVKEYGYYAGILNSVYDLAMEYPKMFKDFFQSKEAQKPTSTPEAPETNTSTEEIKPKQLIDLFEKPLLFPKIIKILADNDYCDRHTYVWKDSGSGNKGIFAALMKNLHHKEYLRRDFNNAEEIVEIAINTFKFKISARTVRGSNLSDDLKDLIPYASSLP